MEQVGNEGDEIETFKCELKYSKLVLNFVLLEKVLKIKKGTHINVFKVNCYDRKTTG